MNPFRGVSIAGAGSGRRISRPTTPVLTAVAIKRSDQSVIVSGQSKIVLETAHAMCILSYMSKTHRKPGRKAKHKSGPMLRLNYRERLEICEALQDLADRLGTDVSTEIRKATAQRVRTMARQ